jgi:glycosyltransferase involved in cell wall biosynthesis
VVGVVGPRALANALGRLLQDPVLRARLGNANRRLAAGRYESSACLDRFVRVYREAART